MVSDFPSKSTADVRVTIMARKEEHLVCTFGALLAGTFNANCKLLGDYYSTHRVGAFMGRAACILGGPR